jgi:flagellin
MLAIKNNLMAEQSARQMRVNYNHLNKSVARLSSGQRIVTAGDDAAGMAVRELIRADVATLRQGSRNARDGISMLQTAEGALSSVDDILVRMKELAEQAATESYSDDQRQIMDEEFQQLISEVDRITTNTAFNGLKMLDGDTETFNIHVGSKETIDIGTRDMTAAGLGLGGDKSYAVMTGSTGTVADINDTVHISAGTLEVQFTATTGQQTVSVAFSDGDYTVGQIVEAINQKSNTTEDESYDLARIHYDEESGRYGVKLTALWGADDNDMTVSATGLGALGSFSAVDGTGEKLSIGDSDSALGALNTVGDAIKSKDSFRAKLGYLMNRMESAAAVVDIEAENLLAAESRISDVDVATEMAALTRHQVLAQAGISMLGQADSMPQMALSLLG